MSKKVVRVTFTVGDKSMYIDREYYSNKEPEENCELAIKFLSDIIDSKKALAVMVMPFHPEADDPYEGAEPGILSFSNIALIIIKGVGIYE